MDWSAHPLLLLAAGIGLLLTYALVRNRPIAETRQVEDALERVRSGERGVRLEPLAWGRDARIVSRFNDAVARIEAGTFDWREVTPRDSEMFDALRLELASQDGALKTFVAVVEIDRFSALRQSTGYRLANHVLEVLGRRVCSAIDGAELGRVGRTTLEFAFKASSTGSAQLRLLDAIDTIEQKLEVGDCAFELTVKIGFADAGTSSIRDELVDQAAAALAAAQAQHVKVCFADANILAQNSLADVELMRALPRALAAGEVDLHYQPKLEARFNRVTSVEALIRWNRPQIGLVPTDRFIALAEETGAIREVTDWVIARAIRDQKTLAAAGSTIAIYVNISGQLLADRDFAQGALALVRGAEGQIGFEITETAVIKDPEAALANLRDFTAAGIRVAIDDYGSGLSSLAYLKQLPAHELKIDRMFISGLSDSHRDPLLVRSSIDLAHALEMEVTAEGVDDPVSLALLRIMGCDLLQGYHISPPVPLAELQLFLGDVERLAALANPSLGLGAWHATATN